jgi:GTP cyclohydrolase II
MSTSSSLANLSATPPMTKPPAAAPGDQYKNLAQEIAQLRAAMRGVSREYTVVEKGQESLLTVTWKGTGPIVRSGEMLRVVQFEIDDEWGEYQALVKVDGDLKVGIPQFCGDGAVFLRIDSGCSTGQVLHDASCECLRQLDMAVDHLAQYREGLIIRIPRQDGRGKGLPFKIATLHLQKKYELDTIAAATVLAEDGVIDQRTYSGVIAVLRFLGISPARPIHLGTNNPRKESIFAENGYVLERSIPILAERTPENEMHLEAKKAFGQRL